MNPQLSADLLLFLGTWLLSALAVAGLHRREFKRSPDKAARYRALPFRYKALCWLLVLPLFAGSLLNGWLLLPALGSLYLAEVLCLRWYRKAGLWHSLAPQGRRRLRLCCCCHRRRHYRHQSASPSPPGCAES